MGITIHFCGRLRKESDYLTVTGLGRAFAHRKDAVVFELDVARKELIRVKDDEIRKYESQVKGISFCIHPDAEPIMLQFDSDDYLCEFCKTQYAGVATHLEVLGFLREIEPYFRDFQVVDEGGYWDTTNLELLEEKFALLGAAIRKMRNSLPDEGLPSEGARPDDPY